MEPAMIGVAGNGAVNILETRLCSICLKDKLKETVHQFRVQDPLENISTAIILWKVASKEIPRVHGEKGRRAIHMMKMMACIRDDTFEYVRCIAFHHFEESVSLAESWGLLKIDPFTKINKNPQFGKINFHSLALMQAIAKVSKNDQLSLLKDCLLSQDFFSGENLFSIWSITLDEKYEDKELFSLFQPWRSWNTFTLFEHQNLFDKIIEKHEVIFGKFHVRTMMQKSSIMLHMLRYRDVSLEEIWKKWDGDGGYKFSFDEFFKTRGGVPEEERATAAEIADELEFCVVIIARILLDLVKYPRPRQECAEKFLNEGIQMGRDLLLFKIIRPKWTAEFFPKMLSYTEELAKAEDVPDLLYQWFNLLTDYQYEPIYNYSSHPEINGIATCLRLATASSTSPSLRQAILEKLLPIIKFYSPEVSEHERLSTAVPKSDLWLQEDAVIMLRVIMCRVQCLELLGKCDEVVQTVRETMKFREYWGDVEEATVYNEEIDRVIHRCPRLSRTQSMSLVVGIEPVSS